MSITNIIRVSLSFANKLGDDALIIFARHILATIYTAAGFTDLPVTQPVLTTAVTAFEESKVAQATGGKPATALKNERRATLVALLKELALFVQVASANNLATLLSSGFEAVSTNRTRVPLSRPAVTRILTGLMSGQAQVSLTREANMRGCEVSVATMAEDGTLGEFSTPVFSSKSLNVVVAGLTPGQLYVFRGRLLGGSTSYSDWSELVTQRAL